MSSAQIEIQLIAVIVALACAIPGTFLVLRQMAMISDAISHSILPGIVIGFLITQNISSPILIFFAALTGVLTVVVVESITKTKLVKEDTAIGLVFPAFFSIGVLIISAELGNIHIDTDAVLVGELAYAPLDRLIIMDTDIGPVSLWVMLGILALTLFLLTLFYKELKISTFDAELAASLGFTPIVIHYFLMSITSLTTVGAFNAVGAILVVALIVVPPASAYLLTNDLNKMLIYSSLIAVLSGIGGYWIAHFANSSISGSIASLLGLIFLFVFLFAPDNGLISVISRQRRQKMEFALLTFLIHLKNHSFTNNNPPEREISHLTEGHFKWNKALAKKILDFAKKNNMISIEDSIINLTERGEKFTGEALNFIINNETSKLEDINERFLLFRG